MNDRVLIRLETVADLEAIRRVNRLAFGQDGEGRLFDALRTGEYARTSLVAEKDEEVVGHILFSDLTIVTASGPVAALSLAPMAVVPEYQRSGIGSALVRRGLDVCRERSHRIVIVVGHPSFYSRFGFSRKLTASLESPYQGEAFMACELISGALHGVRGAVTYPPPFDAL